MALRYCGGLIYSYEVIIKLKKEEYIKEEKSDMIIL